MLETEKQIMLVVWNIFVEVRRHHSDFIQNLQKLQIFEVKIPTWDDWSNQHRNLQNWPEIYADGSKLEVGAGMHSTCLSKDKALRLPDHWRVFQAEIYAIHEASNWLETNRQSVSDVCILSDSHITSRAVLSCSISLEDSDTYQYLPMLVARSQRHSR